MSIRSFMNRQALILARSSFPLFLLLFLISSGFAVEFNDEFSSDEMGFGEKTHYTYGLAASGFAGINSPMNNYDGYRTNPAGGGDIRLLIKTPKGPRYIAALSIDFIPLAPPADIIDFEENIIAANLNITYNYIRWPRYVPFLGLGAGYYWDTLSQEIPNFGSKTDTKTYGGFNAFLGLEYKLTPYISVAGEYKFHMIEQKGTYASLAVPSIRMIVYFGKRLTFNEP
ncbi:MAG: hypothetical protein GF384_06135 [Elusimicrobia bacterium]|nr:hypothetical protein [Elusimicrobiota bacterium]